MANGASMQIWSGKTFFTLGATSTTECELNVPKPITELDGIATERDITSASKLNVRGTKSLSPGD